MKHEQGKKKKESSTLKKVFTYDFFSIKKLKFEKEYINFIKAKYSL